MKARAGPSKRVAQALIGTRNILLGAADVFSNGDVRDAAQSLGVGRHERQVTEL